MSSAALFLVLASTFLHATWNMWSKDSLDRLAFIWWALLAALMCYIVPVGLLTSLALPTPVWPILVASGLAETGYFLSLMRAYDRGDLSLVYPVARGSPPVFTAAWAGLLLSEHLPMLGYVGIGLLVAGIYTASLRCRADLLRPLRAWRNPPIRSALLAGVFISIYSVADKAGLRYMPAAAYNVWVFVVMIVFLAPFVWLPRRHAAVTELRRQPVRIVAGGLLVMGTYFLVLWALEQAPVSYVSALRGTSVLVGAAFGRIFLDESFGWSRIAGAVLMFCGIATLSLVG